MLAIPNFIRSQLQISYFRELTGELTENSVPVRSQDMYTLGMLALNLALVDECMENIDDEGMTLHVEGDRGMVTKTNPAVAVLKDAQSHLKNYFDKFQMSPSSRGNVGTILPSAGNNNSDGFEDL